MKNKSVFTFIFSIFFLLFVPSAVFAQSNSFRFVSWGDTQGGPDTLSSLSNQIISSNLNPSLTIFNGDLESDGFTLSGMDNWKRCLNGKSDNGMFDKTFPVRGNHDTHVAGTTSLWQGYFDMRATAGRLCTTNGGSWNSTGGICSGSTIGPVNFRELAADLTYSFDYKNSHFIGVDWAASQVITSAQTSWIDSDLLLAEGRCLTHAFIYFHGPIYYVDGHSASVPTGLINVINKHKIVSATFHGHEHVKAWVHIDSRRIAGVTHEFEEFVTSPTGTGIYTCASGRSDFCKAVQGFGLVDVSGNIFTMKIYAQGNTTPIFEKVFTKTEATCNPSVTLTSTPIASITPTPTRFVSPTPTSPTPSGCSKKSQGDANCDGMVNGVDYSLWLNSQCRKTTTQSCASTVADFNGDGNVDDADYRIWFEQRG